MILGYKSSCIIGYSGLIGQTLLQNNNFDYLVNSKNLESIKDKYIGIVICAAPSAVKWKINIDDSEDISNINKITSILSTVKCEKIILCSSIDVFGNYISVGNDEDISPDNNLNHNYGRNRISLEKNLADIFGKKLTIARLSGLFGKFLKKNLLFDLKTNNKEMLSKINIDSKFQWYNLNYLYSDLANNLDKKIIHFVNEPIMNSYLFDKLKLPIKYNNSINYVSYNVKTKYSNDYFNQKEDVINDIKNYLNT
jgi:hypothetical protein